MQLSLTQEALLTLAALVAGTVDAIAGGGGLISVPALLAAGLPPQLALGTNKGQSVWGSGSALLSYWRGGAVDGRRIRLLFPLALVGSLLGVAAVLLVPPAPLRPLVLGLLVFVAVVLATRGEIRRAAPPPARRAARITAALALALGFYDGFFGPGTGTLLIIGMVMWLGDSMTGATANAKAANFASNLAAVSLFAAHGVVLWRIALPMAVAQAAGGALGARLALRGGDKLVRRLVLLVVLALVAKVGWSTYAARLRAPAAPQALAPGRAGSVASLRTASTSMSISTVSPTTKPPVSSI